MEIEKRIFKSSFEIRAEGEKKKIVGYGARFNEHSEPIWGMFIEKIAPGAFKNALLTSDPRALFNHDPNYVLGRKSSGTLTLKEDDNGLWYEVDPPDTQFANDLMKSIERGDIKESSFAFTVTKEEWDDSGEIPIRTILEVDKLYDVSPVTYPAYPTASTGTRSQAETIFNAHKEKINQTRNSDHDRWVEKQRRLLNLKEKEI